ncbi:MAG: CDC48 family AAA ATPase [Candidatus Nanoarchaeia archaeon]
MEKTVQLKVVEAIQDDINAGIVRVDSSFMRSLGVVEGDIVEITGQRKALAIVNRSLPGDIGLNIIRMDGLIRRNAKTSIGDFVRVGPAQVKPAQTITLAPANEGVKIRVDNTLLFNRILAKRAFRKGDLVSLGGTLSRLGFGDLKFVVTQTNPKTVASKDKKSDSKLSGVIITEQTKFTVLSETVDLKEEAELPEVSYEDIGGLGEELKKVREMIELPLKYPEVFDKLGIEPPKGVLLHGPPGTGKTLLAKAVANETRSNFYVINGPEIMSALYGKSEENLRNIFEEAQKNAPSIIFIDELDAIAPKREESKGEVERRVVAQLLTIMDGLNARGKVVVMAASNIPNALDPALRRPGRFDREIEINPPDVAGRLTVLKIHTRNMPLAKDVNLEELSQTTHGFVGADLAALAKEAAMNVLRNILPQLKLGENESIPQDVLDKIQIAKTDFREALKVVRPSAMREVLIETPNITYNDIGGCETEKQELEEAVEWPLVHKETFDRMGVRPPKGVLLYGPPGTGKTMLAKAVAKECDANFIAVKGPELLSKWVGESEKAVREIFKKARQVSPSIVFFDEIDSLAPTRSVGLESKAHEKVVNQLLTEMDGLEELNNVVVIAATNRPDVIDTALLRPGRFDRIVLVGVPDTLARQKIFNVHLKGMPLAADVDVSKLVEQTQGYVGADIQAVCREAAMLTLRKDLSAQQIPQSAFDDALTKVRPSADKEIQEAYAKLQEQFSKARGKQVQDNRPSYYG